MYRLKPSLQLQIKNDIIASTKKGGINMTDINITKNIIENKEITLPKYYPLYLFTNENLKNITKKIDFKNKKILTVCSSGDQYFNFLLEQPQKIDIFDINKLTEYILYLKKASIINLEYDEFINFYIPKKISKKHIFSKELYIKKIRDILPQESQKYWDELFQKYTSTELFNSPLFHQNKNHNKETLNNNNYLIEKNYQKLKQILKNQNEIYLHNINIFEETINTHEQYDIIYLSNILDSLPKQNEIETLKIIKQIVNNYTKYLKNDGIIGLYYLFCYLDDYCIKNKKIKEIIKKEIKTNYQIIDFKGGLTYNSNRTEDLDALIIYKKEKILKKS